MRPFPALLAAILVAALPAGPVAAEVTAQADTGFTSRHSLSIAAGPDKVWAILTQPARWWDGAHSYSGDSANLSLDPRAGGCWCEKLAGGGSVEHMRVLFFQPTATLRLAGGLGPLQAMPVNAVMQVTLKPEGQGTRLILTYTVAGAGGLAPLATPVDGVLAQQVARLKAAAER